MAEMARLEARAMEELITKKTEIKLDFVRNCERLITKSNELLFELKCLRIEGNHVMRKWQLDE